MPNSDNRTCIECDGTMSPIIIMDAQPGLGRHRHAGQLEYRLPDDKVSFWSGKYPSAGPVQAYLCADCGYIALYGSAQVAGHDGNSGAAESGIEESEDDDQSEV